MRRFLRTILPCLGMLLCLALPILADEAPLATYQGKVSYALGVEAGRNLKRQGVEIDQAIFARGLADAMAERKLQLSDDDLRLTMNAYLTEYRQRQAKTLQSTLETNRAAGAAYQAEQRKKEGVVTLPSGLQYKVITNGSGKKPTPEDTVTCYYRGTLINGSEFGHVERPAAPASFKLAAVIPGWREALLLMPAGSRWQLIVPPHLAYGQQGLGRLVGPGATLIYDLELVAIQ